MSLPTPSSLTSSSEDMEDRDVVDGDCLGVSLGEPAAVEGAESFVVDVTVRFKSVRWGTAVEGIVEVIVWGICVAATIDVLIEVLGCRRDIRDMCQLESTKISLEGFFC